MSAAELNTYLLVGRNAHTLRSHRNLPCVVSKGKKTYFDLVLKHVKLFLDKHLQV